MIEILVLQANNSNLCCYSSKVSCTHYLDISLQDFFR